MRNDRSKFILVALEWHCRQNGEAKATKLKMAPQRRIYDALLPNI